MGRAGIVAGQGGDRGVGMKEVEEEATMGVAAVLEDGATVVVVSHAERP